MARVAIVIIEWLLKNAVQKILLALGLSVVGYLGTMAAVKYAFNQQLLGLNGLAPDLLALMGIYGVDHVLSSFISVALFLMTLNAGKLAIRKAG
ncbi:DUF2523 domain-containing protein [Acinetobacter courvalinii]|jgi:hypothetical protein|uniref:DUF2523 family protein n=1 Tax=Acinetobacter TaxID=469 RepID=UPI00044CB211|nr:MULTISPECIES: DUF2523 family protein [Acinetobacter]EXB45053.1 hypothetical protein J522_3968 [Acinetobacter baumannii 146457]MCH7341475.1 DUF2523 domain-containing protein [Acinetobacter higginsii]MCU4389290.1 DUF2523 domain-containing protein [Acinetobacter courvalinii]MEB3790931.1 DUF2523 domain-containing protein [Acinetobacter sp. IK40]